MPTTNQTGFTRWSEDRDPISRLLLAVGLYHIYRPEYEAEVPEYMRYLTSKEEWDEDRGMDEQTGKKPNDNDYLEALSLVNPIVRYNGVEHPLEVAEADKIAQLAQWLASARRFGLDYEEVVWNLQHRDRTIALHQRAKGFAA